MLDHAPSLHICVAPLIPEALLPQKAYASDAGFDLAIPADCVCPPQTHTAIDLGFAMQIPAGWYGQIFGRSSIFRRGLAVHPGVIDSDYRGAVQLLIYNVLSTEQRVHRGDRLAQLLLLPVPNVIVRQVELQELSQTVRGTGGIGSTGR
jgi:dUTP pyrophosphatase